MINQSQLVDENKLNFIEFQIDHYPSTCLDTVA